MVILNIRQKFITGKINVDQHNQSERNTDFRNLKKTEGLSQLLDLISDQNIICRISHQSESSSGHSPEKGRHHQL